ncbi:hemolysin family protein [uncultured Duncaniella sp.]|uniref:hemolysin family protein n=1 Tax=uncultured Duncaniella sp. TaxID=2768039 RepID=UPI002629E4F8|nr:hemolysin family protein [uncultured Duncaniella sp.]
MDDILIIICLILLNGIFSMSEVALISARKSKLSADARHGSRKAAIALDLAERPDRFLSTIQIGITLIGILTGLFSGATIANDVGDYLTTFGLTENTAHNLAKIAIVSIVTYLSIVVGELVPKRMGIGRPEGIAKAVAAPMKLLSSIAFPLVWLLSVSTRAITRLLHLDDKSSKVTEEEIKSLIQEGTDAGEVKEVEQNIMERALVLGDCRIASIMTSRKDVASLKIGMNAAEIRDILAEELHSTYPVFDESKESICGIVSLKQLILMLGKKDFHLDSQLSQGLFLPESMTVYDALDTFKRTREHCALVCDEYGCFQGIVTLMDILDGLVGAITSDDSEPMIAKRPDKDEWLIDGQCPVYDFLSYFDRADLYSPSPYTTIGGLLLENLRRMPSVGDTLAWHCFNIEVVDMDHTRIDKVAVSIQPID